MFILAGALILLFIFGIVVRRSRRTLYSDFTADTDIDEYSLRLIRLAKTVIYPESHGKGIETEEVEKLINRAYRLIKRKIVRREELFEFERWLYDNHYVFTRAFKNGNYEEFAGLPHVDNVPRVITLARSIVSLTAGRVDKERVDTAITVFGDISPLTFKETEYLDEALKFAVLEKLAAVSKKCIYYRKMLRIAVRAKNVAKKYVNDNLYVYFTIKRNRKLADVLKDYLDDNARKYDNIDYTFSALLVENNLLTASLVTSLTHIGEYTVDKTKLLEVYKVLSRNEVFARSCTATKKLYLQKIAQLSDKINLTESVFADRLLRFASVDGVHFGELLFNDDKSLLKSIKADKRIVVEKSGKNALEYAYIAANVLITVALSALVGFATLNLWAGLAVGALGLIGLIPLANFIVNKSFGLFVKPRPVFMMNYADIPADAATEVVVPVYIGDEIALRENIVHLNRIAIANKYSNLRFTLLIDFKRSDTPINDIDGRLLEIMKAELPSAVGVAVRRRVACDKGFSGRERKRGAVEDYAAYLHTGDDAEFIFIDKKYKRPEYMLVLDADSELQPSGVLNIVNTFLHPLNAKYDLLALQGKTNLYSVNSLYSRRFLCDGGREQYPSYTPFFYSLTGNAVFQGKGIFRLSSYCEKLSGVLPDNRILSHDVIEGAILNTGFAGEAVYEDVPQNFGAAEDRRLRWARGDAQLLPYLNITKNKNQSEKIRIFYRYLMFCNAFSVFYEPYILALFLTAIFVDMPYLAVFAAAAFALNFVFDTLCGFFGIFTSRRIRYFVTAFVRGVYYLLESLVLLPYKAIVNVLAFTVTAVRMTVTKRGLLNWKPFATGGARDDDVLPVPEKLRQTLTDYAKDIYNFFVSAPDVLIPDHFQSYPKGAWANYTSPTDIGFSVIAEISALKLGFIGYEDAEKKVADILKSAFALKNFNGHLYNWYDLISKKPLAPSFVSSVDSGNFTACTIVAREVFGGDIAKIVDKYLAKLDFKALYDDGRKQFYIGYNGDRKRYEGHYDNLVSEAKVLNYLGVCFGLPIATWDGLTRDFTAERGNTLLSWGGTAFEYLMPDLFLRPPKVGLLRDTSRRASKIMLNNRCHGLFGISESGYFAFDDNRNFRYKAFGIDNLSLKSELSRCVISPYSSYLLLPFLNNKAARNLKKLKKNEAYGDYGFYEAVDFTRSPRLVTEYMSHHLGMSLAALSNYLCDGALVEAFNKNDNVAAGRLLLTERSYDGKAVKPEKNKFIYESKPDESFAVYPAPNSATPTATILKSGEYAVVIDDFGCGYSKFGDIYLNRFKADISAQSGAFFYVTDLDTGITSSPSRAPLNVTDDYEITFTKTEARFCNRAKGLVETVYAPDFFDGELRKLTVTNDTDRDKVFRVYYFAELCLNSFAADVAHRAYGNLFVETSVENGVLYAERNGKNAGEGIYAALYADTNCDYISNRYNFLGRCRDVDNPAILDNFKRSNDDNGTVLDGCLGFVADITVNGGEEKTVNVYTAAAFTKKDIVAEITKVKNPRFPALIKKIPYVVENNKLFTLDNKHSRYLVNLLPALLYKPYPQKTLHDICANYTLFKAFSSDFARKVLLVRYDGSARNLRYAVRLLNLLLSAGVAVSMVISYDERDQYYTPVKAEIMKNIESCVVGRDVFLDCVTDYEVLKKICFGTLEERVESYVVNNPEILHVERPRASDGGMVSGEGAFTANGYEVRPYAKHTLLPYGNVVCGEYGGFIASDNGGYTYYGNSRENKLTAWRNDFVTDAPSERLLFDLADDIFDITHNARVTHAQGLSAYAADSERFTALTSVYLGYGGKTKVVEVTITAKKPIKGSLIFDVDLALGAVADKSCIAYDITDGVYCAVNLKNGVSCYLKVDKGSYISDIFGHSRGAGVPSSANGDTAYAAVYDVSLQANESATAYFFIGGDQQTIAGMTAEIAVYEKEKSQNHFKSVNPFTIKTEDASLNILFNDWLPYQIISARVNGRTSLYQAGGAIGFRDILQDCMAVIYFDKKRARDIIVDAASHVYYEGDVQHWWHGEKHGVRTRISDDRYFLPYVVTEYIKITGDESILCEEVKYLNSPSLALGDDSRYENPPYHQKTDTLLLHLERIMSSARLGENGLLLIGGGDWNDALNSVGNVNAGESVWLTEFYIEVLNRMCELYQGKEKLPWLERAERLKAAVKATYTGKQFKRLITASGEWLGDGYDKTFAIDLISQAWAALADVCDKKYCNLALNAAKNTLYDAKNGIVMLLAPPQTNEKYRGYISLYPKGIRENGGQYTHAAIWYLMALVKENRVDEAYEAFKAVNPISRCTDKNEAKRYMAEPYVLAADVYANEQHKGRAGWTWYTGSAAWCYKLIIEGFLGIRIEGGNLLFNPNPPSCFNGYTVEYRTETSVYTLEFLRRGKSAVYENSVELSAGGIAVNDNERRKITVFF